MATLTDRQESLKLSKYDSIAVAGCGGVGSWVAIELILSGQLDRLFLFDADVLEAHNLNRLPYKIDDIGKNKAEVCKEFLIDKRGDSSVLAYAKDCTPFLLNVACPGVELLIDCTDRFDSQQQLSQWAKETGVSYIRIGCTTNHITISSLIPDWEIGEEEVLRCGVTIPAWVSPCVIAASYGVAKALGFRNLSIGGDIDSLNVMKDGK